MPATMPWYIPFLIFFARICDVSIGTVRVITVIRGHKLLAAVLGFFEVSIWLLAVSGVLRYISQSLFALVAYGCGFATGTLIGMFIEQKIALGQQMIRIVNADPTIDVAVNLRNEGLIVTEVTGQGAMGEVELCFLAAPRRRAQSVVAKILEICPSAFITIEDIRDAHSVFTRLERSRAPGWMRLIKFK
jgi:uncharacterized protein YebE (UPF0316 family)